MIPTCSNCLFRWKLSQRRKDVMPLCTLKGERVHSNALCADYKNARGQNLATIRRAERERDDRTVAQPDLFT